MQIRSYEEADEGQVVTLWREAFPDTPAHNDPVTDIRNKLNIQRELFIVAEHEYRIVGTAMAGFDGHRGWVYYVAVSKSQRRTGIGRALMSEVEARLKALGCPKLNLQVRGSNREVVEFYRALGYQVEDRISLAKHLH